ncbi:hypothetical protein [uncultured Draconibacterium sp.]|uniref:hypothetical protein n=1 Tax=uncultured Draconibacterium sp. TaxID=1573823 RepID=UPI0025D16D3A|nr:hypothetical protein [uncultured Draconibacterium sp.]
MKTTSALISVLILVLCISYSTNAQNEYMDYTISDTVSDENFTIFNMNDFRDALVQLGINVYKWNLPIPQDKDYSLRFYIQEYEKTKLVKDTIIGGVSTKHWKIRDNRARYEYVKNLRIITEIPDGSDKTERLRFRFRLSSGVQFGKSILPRPEYDTYFLRKFAETEFELEKNIPLLLYSAGWEVNSGGHMVRKFCGPNYPPADLDDYSFKNSDHYFILGYKVLDREFYGRD